MQIRAASNVHQPRVAVLVFRRVVHTKDELGLPVVQHVALCICAANMLLWTDQYNWSTVSNLPHLLQQVTPVRPLLYGWPFSRRASNNGWLDAFAALVVQHVGPARHTHDRACRQALNVK